MKFKRFTSPFHPGEILLEEFLQPLGLSQKAFAEQISWTPRKLNEIIRGKRSVTAASAIDLSEVLKTSPEFWLNLQQMWDLDQAYKEKKAG
jgi:addiction module HigA family antidote